MGTIWKRAGRTAQLIVHGILPARGESAVSPLEGDLQVCTPRQLRGGAGRFLNPHGEMYLLFPDCLAIAAPVVLFRLKREGFSCCSVQATPEGLLVSARR